jgi:hypothetical protein
VDSNFNTLGEFLTLPFFINIIKPKNRKMSILNLYEAYSAVYNEDLREDLLNSEEDFSFIDDLSDNELDQVMEEILSEDVELSECFEAFDGVLTEARVDMAARAAARKQYAQQSEKSAKEARGRAAAKEKSERRAERVERIKSSAKRASEKVKTTAAGVVSAAAGGASEAGRKAKAGAEKVKGKLASAKDRIKGFVKRVGKAVKAGASAAKKEFSGEAGKEAKARTTGRQMRRAARRNASRDTSEFQKAPEGTSENPRIGQPGKERKTLPAGRSKTSGTSGSRRASVAKKLASAASGEGPSGTVQQGQPSGTFASKKSREQARKREARLTANESFELLDLIIDDMIAEGYAVDLYHAYVIIENLDINDTYELVESYLIEERDDLFDVILEYLVAEGYADTNREAINIMANMSEEWREEILSEIDEAHKPLPTKKMQNRRYYVNMKTGEAAGSSRNERIRGVLDAYKKDPEGEAEKAKSKSKYKG